MAVTVFDELLQAARLNESEFPIEIAVALFQQDRLTLGQASTFAGIGQLDMQRTLAARGVPIHYGLEDLEQDLATVRKRLHA
jgi:predicted HTH domain antitoxin